ncbi:MAG: hypothetical protein ACYCS7_00675 [Acidimicrobiales bacterium]
MDFLAAGLGIAFLAGVAFLAAAFLAGVTFLAAALVAALAAAAFLVTTVLAAAFLAGVTFLAAALVAALAAAAFLVTTVLAAAFLAGVAFWVVLARLGVDRAGAFRPEDGADDRGPSWAAGTGVPTGPAAGMGEGTVGKSEYGVETESDAGVEGYAGGGGTVGQWPADRSLGSGAGSDRLALVKILKMAMAIPAKSPAFKPIRNAGRTAPPFSCAPPVPAGRFGRRVQRAMAPG